jgi:hypothetical protein
MRLRLLSGTSSCISGSIAIKVNTLQRHNTENSKQIFPEKELRGHSPNFYIYVSVGDLYIHTIGLPILLQEYIDRSQTNECGNWDWGRAIPFLGTHKSKFTGLHAQQLFACHLQVSLRTFVMEFGSLRIFLVSGEPPLLTPPPPIQLISQKNKRCCRVVHFMYVF